MKILHIPFCFYPDPVGGTEVYVESLSQELMRLNHVVVIAAPAAQNTSYLYNQLPVKRYAVKQQITDLREVYGHSDTVASESFRDLLYEVKPDLVHFHAFTSGVSLGLVREAKKQGIPTVFTYHTPTVTCTRGTLMRLGSEVCKGYMDAHLCTKCTLKKNGLPQLEAGLLSTIPATVGKTLGHLRVQGKFWTAIRMRELITLRHEITRALFAEVDKIVVLCNWTKELLIENNIPDSKIVLVRHGITDWDNPLSPHTFPSHEDEKLRMIYLGRIDPTKGLHILLKALRNMPSVPIELDIYGVVQAGNDAYSQEIADLVHHDPRTRILPPVSNDQIIPLLRQYDLLAVPSQWLETGPLVILEAFAAGIPVIGSNLGGIAELIQDRINGILVQPNSIIAWEQALSVLVNQPEIWSTLQQGVKQPKKMVEVAQEMLTIYDTLI